MVWHCALALHAATPLYQLSLFLVCQSVIIFCNPRWKRVCFRGLRRGLAMGTGPPVQAWAALGKVSGLSSTKRFNTRICHRTSARKTDSKRGKVNGPWKMKRHMLTHLTIESAAETRGCFSSNAMVCKPLTSWQYYQKCLTFYVGTERETSTQREYFWSNPASMWNRFIIGCVVHQPEWQHQMWQKRAHSEQMRTLNKPWKVSCKNKATLPHENTSTWISIFPMIALLVNPSWCQRCLKYRDLRGWKRGERLLVLLHDWE